MSKETMARKFARLWKRERAVKEARRELGSKLMALIKASGKTGIQLGREIVQLVVDTQKRPAKKDVQTYFGKVAAEDFWGGLKAAVSEYLTVIPAKG